MNIGALQVCSEPPVHVGARPVVEHGMCGFAARTEGLRGACVWRSSHNQKGNHLSVPNLVDFLRRQAELGELGLEHKFKHIIGVEQLQG